MNKTQFKRFNFARFFPLCALVVFMIFASYDFTNAIPFHAKEKKVILFSGGGGTTGDVFAPDIVSRIPQLDALPIDGIYFKPKKRTLMNGFIPLFDNQVWNETQFDMTAMSQIQWGRVKDNGILTFTQYSVTVDWWNDATWNTICNNMKLLSKVMKTANVTGFLFDCEYYGEWQTPPFFDPATYPGHTWDELSAKVRQRGAEWMKALMTELPYVQIVSVYANYNQGGQGGGSWYALVPPFAEGCLSVGGPKSSFTDGKEYHYYTYNPMSYFGDYAGRNRVAPRIKYPDNYLLGYPVYWNPISTNSKVLEQIYYMGTLCSDQYVWVFTEGVNWLKNGMDPLTNAAFSSARTKLASGKPLGYSDSPVANITTPQNNTKFSSGSSITVDVAIPSGTASKVVLYANSINVGTDDAAPYSFTVSNLADGFYTIIAVAYDGTAYNLSNFVTIAMGDVSSDEGPIYFTCSRQASIETGGNFSFTVTYENTTGSAATLTYVKKPSWITATNGNPVISGKAPGAPSQDTVRAIVIAAGKSDTLNLIVKTDLYYVIEAESGTLTAPMQVGSDASASGGKYISAPVGSGNTIFPKPEATYTINLAQTGTYYVWLRIYKQTMTGTSIYGTFIGFNGTFVKPGISNLNAGQYEWILSQTNFKLNAGANQFIIGHGSEEARIDKIILSTNYKMPANPPTWIVKDKKNFTNIVPYLNIRTIPNGAIEFLGNFESNARLNVIDVSGRTVWSWKNQNQANRIVWDAKREIGNNMYFAVWQAQKSKSFEAIKFIVNR